MPSRILRFCCKCLTIRQTQTHDACGRCGVGLLPLLDSEGAISRDFLIARKTCCDSGCRNCPYEAAKANGGHVGSVQAKLCPRCGTAFGCQSEGCWCASVQLSAATLKWLERSYADCLCPACVEEFSIS